MFTVVNFINNATVSAKSASTIVLIRPAEPEFQVYLLKRNMTSGFFPGSYVFPGGAVNPEDRETDFWQQHIDLPPENLIKIFGSRSGITEIIAYGVAAIRETCEEAGVLLARRKEVGNGLWGKIGGRASFEKLDSGWLRKIVLEEKRLLSFSDLFPWSHWITPEIAPKRFDTRFFLAFMPEGQECLPDDLETVHGLWVSPKEGLQGNREGRIPLTPPTLVTLHELFTLGTLDRIQQEIQTRTWGDPLRPILLSIEKEAVLIQPWDPQYGKPVEIDPDGLPEKVLPVGEPFSRLWMDQGIWRPIGI
jgi:8-oxo-dGTP pyrophosphatase MutT (NUDIX family)